MSNNLKIVQSVYSGLRQREVARQLHVGRNRVARLVAYARSQGWFTPEDLDPLDEASFSAALPEKQSALRDTGIHMPNYEEVHERLAGVHVTLVTAELKLSTIAERSLARDRRTKNDHPLATHVPWE